MPRNVATVVKRIFFIIDVVSWTNENILVFFVSIIKTTTVVKNIPVIIWMNHFIKRIKKKIELNQRQRRYQPEAGKNILKDIFRFKQKRKLRVFN